MATILDRFGRGTWWVHTTWVVYYAVWLPYFWWFTFDWRRQDTWVFPVFFFVVAFAMLTYLVVFVLIPTDEDDTQDLEAYFFRVRPQFFSLKVLVGLADVIDTFLKPGNLEDVGPTYLPAMGFFLIGNVVAASTASRRFHQFWVTANMLAFAVVYLGVFADVFSSG